MREHPDRPPDDSRPPETHRLLGRVARLLVIGPWLLTGAALAYAALEAAEEFSPGGGGWQAFGQDLTVAALGLVVVWLTAGRAKRMARLAARQHGEILALHRALAESETRYRLITESVSDVIFTLDLHLRPTYLSPSVARLRAYGVEEAMAQPLEALLAAGSVEVARQAFAEALAAPRAPGGTRTLELELTRRDGSTVWTETKVSLRRDAAGRPVEIVGVARDITARRQVEAIQREAATLHVVAALASGAAHEIKTPLTVVIGRLELLLAELPSDARGRGWAEKACAAAERIQEIVRRMQRLTRVEYLDQTDARLPLTLDIERSSAVGAASQRDEARYATAERA